MLSLKGNLGTLLLWYSLSMALAILTPGLGESAPSPVRIVLVVLAITGLILLGLRYLEREIVRKLALMMELAALVMVLGHLLQSHHIFPWLAITVPLLRLLFGRRAENASTTIVTGGLAGIIGKAMRPEDALILLILMAVYDALAVFVTGHMKTLARELAGVEECQTCSSGLFSLGSGDVIVPGLLVGSLSVSSPVLAFATALGALLGVFAVSLYSLKRPRLLPALPFIAAFQLVTLALLR